MTALIARSPLVDAAFRSLLRRARRRAASAPLVASGAIFVWLLLSWGAARVGSALGRSLTGTFASDSVLQPLAVGCVLCGCAVGLFGSLALRGIGGPGRQLAALPVSPLVRGTSLAGPLVVSALIVAFPPVAVLLAHGSRAAVIDPAIVIGFAGVTCGAAAVTAAALERLRRIRRRGAATVAFATASTVVVGLNLHAKPVGAIARLLAAGGSGAWCLALATVVASLAAGCAWLIAVGDPHEPNESPTRTRSRPLLAPAPLSAAIAFGLMLIRRSDTRLATRAACAIGVLTIASALAFDLAASERATYLLLALGAVVLLGGLAPLRAVTLGAGGRWLWSVAPARVAALGAAGGSAVVALGPAAVVIALAALTGTDGVAVGPVLVLALLLWASGLVAGSVAGADDRGGTSDAVALGLLVVISGALGSTGGLAVDRAADSGVPPGLVAAAYVSAVSLGAVVLFSNLVLGRR
ncbi:MAG: hypothetical protein ACKVUT_00270 [Gaiella sp.]